MILPSEVDDTLTLLIVGCLQSMNSSYSSEIADCFPPIQLQLSSRYRRLQIGNSRIIISMNGLRRFILCLLVSLSVCINPTLEVSNKEVLKEGENSMIMKAGELSDDYNQAIFKETLSCRNGNLNIIEVHNLNFLEVAYSGIPPLSFKQIKVSSSPNSSPQSYLQEVNNTHFKINFNCNCGKQIQCNSTNYFNLIHIDLPNNNSFSFLLNCDPDHRHKQFQYGYLLISLINSAVIIGVAMHSHVWSIRYKQKPLRYVLYWKQFLIFSIVGVGLVLFITSLTYRDFWRSFAFVKYFGIVISIFFVFLCCNEVFFLFKKLKKTAKGIVRWCDILSGVLTALMTVIAFLFDNWILYDIIAGCICVGSIKIFHFNSLKESFLAMGILTVTIGIMAAALHFLLPMSYNDYAGELSSPLFFEVPDLVNNLFKKCSWLPIIDVIIPGVTLSFLRVYDENKSSKWGGIYTVSGNITFVVSTIIWILIELVDPFSCPFSLITCPLLMLVIFIISWKRNDWKTLLNGQFQQGYFDFVDLASLKENRQSFSKLVPADAMSDMLIKDQAKQEGLHSSILTG